MVKSPLRVTSLAWFGGRVWAASYGAGLFVYEGGIWRPVNKQIPRFITCLSADAHRLWYGSWMTGQVGYLDADHRAHPVALPRLITPRSAYRVNCLTISGPSVWFGTEGYLLEYRLDDDEWVSLLRLGEVLSLAGADSSLWVGTKEGLIVVERTQHTPYSVRLIKDRLEVSAIFSGGSSLYLGTYSERGGYIQRYSVRTGHFKRLGKFLPGQVSDIVVAGTQLFAGVGSGNITQDGEEEFFRGGVFAYSFQERYWYRVEPVELRDVWCLLRVGETLWIGGYAGVQQIRIRR